MSDIKLTPARLDVLKAVAAGEVKRRRSWTREPDEDTWGHKRVNAAVEFLRNAKLIRIGRSTGPSMYSSQMWELTDAGEQYLASLTTEES